LLVWWSNKTILTRSDASLDFKWEATHRILDKAATSGLVVVLVVALETHEGALHEAALSTRWIRRLGAALNQQLTEKDRKRLLGDANAIVRAVARDTGLRDRLME
jgi:hypothetical protein